MLENTIARNLFVFLPARFGFGVVCAVRFGVAFFVVVESVALEWNALVSAMPDLGVPFALVVVLTNRLIKEFLAW